MADLIKLLREAIELRAKSICLKKIKRAAAKSVKLREKLILQNRKVRLMAKIYNETYKEDPIVLKKISSDYEVK